HRLVAYGVLAAFAGVGAAAQAIERDGKCGVRLPRDRAEGHGAAREALRDLGRGLDFLNGKRLFREPEVEKGAKRDDAGVLLADLPRVFLEFAVLAAPHCVLQKRHGLRRPDMRLAMDAREDLATGIEREAIVGRVAIGEAMAAHRLLGDLA